MSALVSKLLLHYWTADDHPALRQAQVEDWIDDLVEFPIEVVEEACRMWRRANSRRPTPHDIRDLAIAERAYRRLPPVQPTPQNYLPSPDLSADQIARHRQAIAPLWKLVARAKAGENADYLIRVRMRFTRKMFARNPESRYIDQLLSDER